MSLQVYEATLEHYTGPAAPPGFGLLIESVTVVVSLWFKRRAKLVCRPRLPTHYVVSTFVVISRWCRLVLNVRHPPTYLN